MPGVVKHSLRIAGHRTSISLEAPFWNLLRDAAAREGLSIAAYVGRIDGERRDTNLSSAIRIHLIETLMAERGAMRAHEAP